MKIKLAPSLLAADFSKLGEDIKGIQSYVDMLHLDVMDGHFVPNISFGPPVIEGIRGVTDIEFDVHLMIEKPLSYIEKFVIAGADIITIHVEAPDDTAKCIQLIKSLGKKVGIALNPDTPPYSIKQFVDEIDMVLQMTVFPGFGGQSMVKQALENIPLIREMIGPNTDLQVDGGIYTENCGELTALGANVIVSGTGIFRMPNPVVAALELRKAAIAGQKA
ncbi:MAG: ribulose-phosphate 3-epimerase [Clostridiaceae bacterium]|jgi:ribulose-phosphate 3-epimerase|nr:ribulose-phosphate 3-epimerase [Clostridiaceae bacterium]